MNRYRNGYVNRKTCRLRYGTNCLLTMFGWQRHRSLLIIYSVFVHVTIFWAGCVMKPIPKQYFCRSFTFALRGVSLCTWRCSDYNCQGWTSTALASMCMAKSVENIYMRSRFKVRGRLSCRTCFFTEFVMLENSIVTTVSPLCCTMYENVTLGQTSYIHIFFEWKHSRTHDSKYPLNKHDLHQENTLRGTAMVVSFSVYKGEYCVKVRDGDALTDLNNKFYFHTIW